MCAMSLAKRSVRATSHGRDTRGLALDLLMVAAAVVLFCALIQVGILDVVGDWLAALLASAPEGAGR